MKRVIFIDFLREEETTKWFSKLKSVEISFIYPGVETHVAKQDPELIEFGFPVLETLLLL